MTRAEGQNMKIAVLALQGAFLEHEQMLRRLGADTFEIRKAEDWEKPKDGLIIPGGESTTQAKLLRELGLMEPVREAITGGLPVWGTCAGLILLADHVVNDDPSAVRPLPAGDLHPGKVRRLEIPRPGNPLQVWARCR